MIEDNSKNKKKFFRNKLNIKNRFFKSPKDVISFFLPIIITACLLIPVPYYVTLGGGYIDLSKKISVGKNNDNGFFGALYVRESRGNVLTYLLSSIVPSFEKEKINDVTMDEDTSQYNYRERLYFTSSLDAATKVAFDKAGFPVKVKSSKFLVIYIDKKSKTELRAGDEIVLINGKSFSNYDEMQKLITSSTDEVLITVNRDGKKVSTKNKFITVDGDKKLGIVISNEIKYSSDPKVKFDFGNSEAGPSGGLMISLTIYDKLIKEDITGGRIIVGTGIIDTSGNVGEIGGVKHKLMAANRKGADIVFVPYGNYDEALKYYNDNNYKFDLVAVKTFDDAVKYLKEG